MQSRHFWLSVYEHFRRPLTPLPAAGFLAVAPSAATEDQKARLIKRFLSISTSSANMPEAYAFCQKR